MIGNLNTNIGKGRLGAVLARLGPVLGPSFFLGGGPGVCFGGPQIEMIVLESYFGSSLEARGSSVSKLSVSEIGIAGCGCGRPC